MKSSMASKADIDALLQPNVMGLAMIGTAIITFFALIFGPTAPYGRYTKSGWGFLINGRIAWFTQELWSFAVPVVWMSAFATKAQMERVLIPANTILMGTFLVHYTYRDLIFPFRLRASKPTPFVVWAMAAVFCIYNGYMQTRYLLNQAPLDPEAHHSVRFIAGIALWFTGWVTNLHSDNILISLRKPGDKKGGYRIPRGGAFEYVSAANYFGEILEWSGWALASNSIPAVAFALFTFANLAPRGWKHHQWYKNQFKTYPKKRRAIIPYLW